MIIYHKDISIHVEYDPNLPIPQILHSTVDTVTETMNQLNFKSAIDKKLQSKLTPQQLKLLRVSVK